MIFTTRNRAAAAVLAMLLGTASSGAFAQDATPVAPAAPAAAPAVDDGAVVARVGEAVITEGDLKLAEADFANELGQVPADRRRSVLIDVLVDMEILAAAGRDAGLDKSEEFKQRMEFLQTRALRNAYVEKEIIGRVSPAELKAEYDRQVKTFTPQEEIRARHILVDTKEQADKIIADLKAGGSFEELAKQSKDGSGQNGGDLGFFARGQMVGPFEDAAFALQPGAVTETPVQSQFGWHVIKSEEKRMSAPPPQAEVEDQLRNVLLRQKFETVMGALRQKFPVEIVGAPAGQSTEPAAADPAAPAAAPPASPAPAPAGSEAAPAPAPAN